jgi:hypothetical protein
MASKLAEVFVDITGNAAPLHKALAGVKSTLMGIGNINLAPVGLGLAAVGEEAGAGLFKANQSATELNATLSRTRGIVGDAAGGVIDRAGEMARAFGQSTTQYASASANIGTIVKDWVGAIAGGFESVDQLGRNLGDGFKPAEASVNAFVNHWDKRLGDAAGAAGAFASYLAEGWREQMLRTLEGIGTAAGSFGGDVASAVKQAGHSLTTFGNDPTESTLFQPLREASDASDPRRSSLPESHFNDVESRRRAIVDGMFDRDRNRLEARAREGVAIARGNGSLEAGASAGTGAAAMGARGRPEDLASFSSTLQDGFPGNDIARQSLKVQQQQLDVAKQQLALQKKPTGALPGIAVGPA